MDELHILLANLISGYDVFAMGNSIKNPPGYSQRIRMIVSK